MTTGTTRCRILIAGGGTAGHVLPGIAVADALVARGEPADGIMFAGGDRGVEADLVGAAGYSLTELPGRGIQRRLTWSNVTAAWSLARGVARGVALVRRLRPDVVMVLGGYASFACGVGAVVARRPLVLCEQNARAGAVNRALRFFARSSAVTFPGTDLPRATVTGNPLRSRIVAAARAFEADPEAARAEARRTLDLPADRVVVLVATGSLGSRSVNEAVRDLAVRWRDRSDVAIRHVVGRRDHGSYVADPPVVDDDALVYQLVAYEDRMDVALTAADLVIGRSGGGVAELAALGVPAVLVPLPIAPRDHQSANARHLVDAGGALLLEDASCTGERLAEFAGPIVDDATMRATMSDAMRRSARIDAADAVAGLVLEAADAH